MAAGFRDRVSRRSLEPTSPMQTVTSADGTSIAYERHGDGPPLVLLHGGGTRQFWQPLLPGLVDDYTVITPDRRGCGDSGDSDAYSIQREVEDLRAVIATLDDEPALFGHSFGGLQAIETARVESVAAVVAYEPAYLVGDYRDQADLASQMQAKLEAGDRRGAMKLHLREVLDGGQIEDFDRWLAEWPGWPDAVEHVENTVRMDRALERHQLAEDLTVDAPALLLTGTDGPAHLRDSIRAVHDTLSASRLVEFDGVSHLGPLEAPDRVTAELRSFLDSQPKGVSTH